jgi:alkylation response protein AidB-like acyl-CoA dehydrogenase
VKGFFNFMDFENAERNPESLELEDYRQRAREWLRANLKPGRKERPSISHVIEGDSPEFIEHQRQLQHALFLGGYAGITWPKEYGGQGLSQQHQVIFDQESRDFETPDLVIWSGTFTVCAPVLLAYASETFKRTHFPKMLAGEEMWVRFFSEADAGSDLANVSTRAVSDGNVWRITGSKTWSSGADHSDFGLCLARTNPELPKHQGLTWFAVPIKTSGVTTRRIRQIDGSEAFSEAFFENVIVPDEFRVGPIDDGWNVTRAMLVYERDSGVYKDRIELTPGRLAPDLVNLARASGQIKDSWVRQLIAVTHANNFASRQLAVRATDQLDRDVPAVGVAAYAKLAAGVFEPIRAQIGMIVGSDAAIAWTVNERFGRSVAMDFLNGRVMSIAGGSNEMQRNAIAEIVHGLPREPSSGEKFAKRN